MHKYTLPLLALIIGVTTLHNNAQAAFRRLPRIAQSFRRDMRPTYCTAPIARRLLTQQTASESTTAPAPKAPVPLNDFCRFVNEESIERVPGAIEQGVDKTCLDATIKHAKTARMFYLLASQYKELDPKAVKRFLERSSQQEAEELLLYAARFGNEALVKILLQEGANPNAQHFLNRIPLISAAFFGHEPIMNILLHNGADVNAQQTGFRLNALIAASL